MTEVRRRAQLGTVPSMAELPMFPLGMTLLPGAAVPLHVFEPRYVEMVRDLLADDRDDLDFGVVMIERGHEVGGGDVRADVATLGRIVELQALPDDRYALVVLGIERVRVERWLDDAPYPRAEVAPWADDPGDDDLAERVDELLAAGRGLNAMLRELGHDDMPELEPGDDHADTLYRLAASTPLGPVDRYRVLAATSLGERCRVLGEAIADARAVLEFRRS